MRILATAAAVTLVFACGKTTDDPSDDAIDANAVLTIDPGASQIDIAPGMPKQLAFHATATYPDGGTRDVTADVAFSLDAGIGSFQASTLSVGTAGKATVTGSWLFDPDETPKFATATVIANLKGVRVDPTLDPNTPDLFATLPEDGTLAPTIVYPPANVVMPRNLGDFEAHWTDANGFDVFELSLHTEFVDIRTYVPGGNGLAFAGTMPTWASFLAAEWMAAVGNEKQLTFQVRGLNKAAPTVIGTTTPQPVKLSNEAMEGGIYYWAIYDSVGGAQQVSGIWRHDMTKPGEPAEEFYSTNTAGKCVACHALSRDGTKMSLTYSGGNGQGSIIDVATKTPLAPTTNWDFSTFTPSGNEMIGSSQGTLTVRNASDMATVIAVPTGAYATHPDVSPDGLHIAYVAVGSPGGNEDWHFSAGQIVTIDYDPTTHTFGAPKVLVSDTSQNNYYPSWSPDNQWILYNRSDSDAYNDANASLWVIKADGTQPAIELARANRSLGLTNSWGRWAPFAQTVGGNFTPMYWITVSSTREFGVRKPSSYPQIWMLPFTPSEALAQHDPSAAAFRLPFQDLLSHNHIAQWAERVVVTQ